MEIIAHRGASYDAPENTLASVRLAWKQNADAAEVDIQCSKDGHIMVIHDDNTRRTGRVRKKTNEQTLAELKGLDVGRWKHPRWAGEQIPTLDEVLHAVPAEKRLFVEIKDGPHCLVELEKVFRRSAKRLENIVAIGFDLETMKLLKRELPELEVCWISEFKRNWQNGSWSPKPETLLQKIKDAGLNGLDLGAKGPINAAFAQQVKDCKLKLYVWTVDSPAKARTLLRAGVDGITTNRPGWLKKQLGAEPPRLGGTEENS